MSKRISRKEKSHNDNKETSKKKIKTLFILFRYNDKTNEKSKSRSLYEKSRHKRIKYMTKRNKNKKKNEK